ncbi:hypothetical protein scyTo_0021108, partial [Scyliorhinus torazame]|nr:hypothetical protein [Scyliorhinus torazame]
ADAYCLLDVYDALQKDPQHFGLSCRLEEFLMLKMEKRGREKKPKRKKSSPSIPSKTIQPTPRKISLFPPMSPSEFSVVCDNMLQGLGRYLRCLGVDVKILENEDDHRVAAEVRQLGASGG